VDSGGDGGTFWVEEELIELQRIEEVDVDCGGHGNFRVGLLSRLGRVLLSSNPTWSRPGEASVTAGWR
jgi:hypothetical protein